MKKFLSIFTLLCSTSFACHYCDECRQGKISEEDQKIYIESGSIFVQNGQILWIHEGDCFFLNSLIRDDDGIYVWSDQIIHLTTDGQSNK